MNSRLLLCVHSDFRPALLLSQYSLDLLWSHKDETRASSEQALCLTYLISICPIDSCGHYSEGMGRVGLLLQRNH